MGWLISIYPQSKDELIARRTKNEDNADYSRACLAHSLKGEVLWTAWEFIGEDSTGKKWKVKRSQLSGEMSIGWLGQEAA